MAELLYLAMCLFRTTEYQVNKLPAATKRATVSLKVKSCNALLCIVLVRVRSYIKCVLGYKCSYFWYVSSSGQCIFK
jgi:hypothetical protein